MRRIDYSRAALDEFVTDLSLRPKSDPDRKLLYDYPTVYVIHDESHDRYDVYVGETSDISRRTIQHLHSDARSREDWENLAASESSQMYVIGHPLFNKSLTLDVENRMMLYLTGVPAVRQMTNRKTNAQRSYFTQEHFDEVFSSIWRSLGHRNKRLFPAESIIRDSALFKASPFHKLTDEQLEAKFEVHAAILEALQDPTLADAELGKLIVVKGAAGTGKTVLMSALFYELFQGAEGEADPFSFQDLDAHLLVNHEQQLTVYQQVAKKLGLDVGRTSRVNKPTSFINAHSPERKAEVVLVDEAHLLWTQGKQSYRGSNQLLDLLRRSKVVVAILDPQQALNTNQYWEPELKSWLDDQQTITLRQQMRIDSEPQTWQWLRSFIDEGSVGPLPMDSKYQIKVFDSPTRMFDAIRAKNRSVDAGLSRMLATYDWDYRLGKSNPDGGKWRVDIHDFSAPWNLQVEYSHSEKRAVKGLSWAEQPATIDEIGSTFTIQGFDLNYAGVIIGPSVVYCDGRVQFVRSASSHDQATQQRGMADGTKVDVSEELLRNQLNVLLTRGVHGLYIYAVDSELQRVLLEAQANRTLV